MKFAALTSRSVRLGLLVSTVGWTGLVACSGSDGSSADGSSDLSDDKAKKDAGKDAAVDAGKDAGGDAAADAGKDAAADAGKDSGSPTGAGLTLITEPDEGLTAIYDLVAAAKTSVDLTMYELVDTTMTSALTAAAKRGVTVRVILDQNEEMSSNETAYKALTAGGVSVHWANTTYTVTHQKTLTIDATTSAIMTLNLVTRDYSTSRDFAVITTDASDVAAIETTFAADFTNATITPPTGDDLVWSPTNSETSILDLINGAKTSLLIENEEMEDTDVISALISAASRGVSVKVIMTNSSSYSSEFKKLVAGGVKLNTYASTASLYIHAKAIVADDASTFLGSENFSTTSLSKNRELGLISTDSAVISSVSATLTSDFNGGTAY